MLFRTRQRRISQEVALPCRQKVYLSAVACIYDFNIAISPLFFLLMYDAGHYCTRNASTPTPLGFDRNYGECACLPARSKSKIAGIIGPRGHYCPRGSVSPRSCVPGTYSNKTRNKKAEDCRPCTAGFLCSNASTISPTQPCPAGYFCPTGTVVATPCAAGSSCVEGSSINVSCPAGRYQPLSRQSRCIKTPSGFFSQKGAISYQDCPMGHYCPRGTSFATQFPCPNGTFSNSTNLYHESQCSPCLHGMFCNSMGLTQPSGYCSPGYFCSSGALVGEPLYTW